MLDDCYALLGVSRDASSTDIKCAYRKLVRECHPDLNPTLPDAEERLKRLNKAYELLRDSAARARYNRALELLSTPWRTRVGPPQPPPSVIARRRSAILPMVITAGMLSAVVYLALVCGVVQTFSMGRLVQGTWSARSPAARLTGEQTEASRRWTVWFRTQDAGARPPSPLQRANSPPAARTPESLSLAAATKHLRKSAAAEPLPVPAAATPAARFGGMLR